MMMVVGNILGLALVETTLDGVLEIANIPEVSDGITISSRTDTVVLVILVIKDEEFLPGGVGDPALVGVCASDD
jgi:hypothetical protein